jgi:hypothetical protein
MPLLGTAVEIPECWQRVGRQVSGKANKEYKPKDNIYCLDIDCPGSTQARSL